MEMRYVVMETSHFFLFIFVNYNNPDIGIRVKKYVDGKIYF